MQTAEAPALPKLKSLRKGPRSFTFKTNIPGDSNQQSLQNVDLIKATFPSVFYCEHFQTYRKIQRIFSDYQHTHNLDSTTDILLYLFYYMSICLSSPLSIQQPIFVLGALM